MTETWRLDDARQTFVLASTNGLCPEVVYWGAPLPAQEDLAAFASANALDVTGGMLDANPDLSLCPEASRSFPGQPGLVIRGSDGTPMLPKFKLGNVVASDLKLTVTCLDAGNRLTYVAEITLDPETHVFP